MIISTINNLIVIGALAVLLLKDYYLLKLVLHIANMLCACECFGQYVPCREQCLYS